MFRSLGFMTFAAATLAPAAAFAHHSAAPYDFTREVVFEGTVTKLEWQNPHILFTLETRDAEGNSALQEVEVVPGSLVRTWGLPRCCFWCTSRSSCQSDIRGFTRQ